MKEILTKFFENVLMQKNIKEEEKQKLIDYFLGDSDAKPNELCGIDFTPTELTFLAEHLTATENPIFLGNFLRYHLAYEKFDAIVFLLSKMFVSHIGKIPYSNKNSFAYDNLQRTFDRFVEACNWTNIDFDEWKKAILVALFSDNSQILSNWKIPSKNFLTEWVVRDEKEFYDFLFSNFSDYGMAIFTTLIDVSVPSAIPKLVDYWLNNSFEEERQVKNILKTHFEEIETYVQQLEKESAISTENLVKLLLVFEDNEDVKNKLFVVLEKSKDEKIKQMIVEGLNLELPEKNITFAQAKKNSQKINTQNLKFLGQNLSNFPKLKLQNGEIADDQFVAYYLQCYQNLGFSKESGELKFFQKFFESESMDNFSNFVAQKLVSNAGENDWAFSLIQNVTPNGATEIMRKMIKVYKNNQKPLNRFLKQYIFEHKTDAFNIFNSLNRQNFEDKHLQDALLKNMIETKIYTNNEIESLKDKIVPNFDIQEGGTYEFEGFKMKINVDFEVDLQKEVGQAIPRTVEIEQKRLAREVQKQIRRLEKAFHNKRLWTEKDFIEQIASNKLMCFLTQNLLWGRYNDGNLVSVFCLKNGIFQDILSIDTKNNCLIGLFHPVELDDYDLKTMFNGKNAPFNQLYVQVNRMSSYNPHSSCVAKFNGFMVNFVQFFGKIKQFDWKLSLPTLDGYVSRLQKANEDLGFIAEISFSPVSLNNLNINVVMGELRFYNLKDVIKTGNNYIVSKANSLELEALPQRYFSDTIFEINVALKK